MYESIEKIKPELEKVIEFLKRELGKIRTGVASPAMVEDIVVELFSQKMPLKHLAAISCPEQRQILIQPWDKSYLDSIQKSLLKSNLGANPIVDRDVIRIYLPSLTQDYRESLLRLISEKAEMSRQTIRRWREGAWSEIQKLVREGKLKEDDKFKGKEELQKIIDQYQKRIEELVENKKNEILA